MELLGIGLNFLDLLAPFCHQRNLLAIEFRLEERETFRDTAIEIDGRSHRVRPPCI